MHISVAPGAEMFDARGKLQTVYALIQNDNSRVIGFNTGWCLHCRDAVQLSVFETQGWILGVLVVLTTLMHFDLHG